MTAQKYAAIFLAVMVLLLLGAFIELMRTSPGGRAILFGLAVITLALVAMAGRMMLTGGLP